MREATRKWLEIARKWRNLAERRANHHVELFQSGRWKHYYDDETFLREMRAAIVLARRWNSICSAEPPRLMPPVFPEIADRAKAA